ncbi:MAG: alpha-amylase family glycosyl hydrolase, partial [Elusimicrobiota bacterium]
MRMYLFRSLTAAVVGAALSGAASLARASEAPDWRDQVVYFLMTDRFADGDPSNNDQKAGEYGPADPNLFSGGDLSGVRSRLDYIQGLGATAVWLTPPVANVWYDPSLKMAGYHGYWASDFTKVDTHLGTLSDYRGLADDLHARKMLLIQDIVANHTGDFFAYSGAYDPADPAKNFTLKPGMVPPRPTQGPFSSNDARDPEARRLGAYHWTPDLADFNDESQLLTHQVSGLDDIDTSNPLVRRTLRESYNGWIKAADVDGFRVDTARYVEHDFWSDFIHSKDPKTPGVEVFARGLGKKDFLVFGEVWANATPFGDKEDVLTASYLGSPEKPGMGAMLNFPLAWDLRSVFGKGAPPAGLVYRLRSMNRHYLGGRASVNFVDNHDMPRFLTEGSEEGLVQALAALFTIPGMPVVYAGTEQGFTETRAAMFAKGWGSGGKDRFDRSHRLYGLIRRLADLRAAQPVLRRGSLVPLFGAAWGPGPLAWRVDPSTGPAGSGAGASILVVFNTAEEEMLAPRLETRLPAGTRFTTLLGLKASGQDLRVGTGGGLLLRLPARSILVLEARPVTPFVAGDEAEEELLEAGVMINKV